MSDATVSAPADVAFRQTTGHQRFAMRRRWMVLVAISVGGALGAVARYGLTVAFPHDPGRFPWATFGTNVAGCLLIGILMVLATEVWTGRRLLRPFLGIGLLGGFTTFSTYVFESQETIDASAPGTALAYLSGTLVSALVAVWMGMMLTRWAVRPRRRHRHSPHGLG